MLSLPHLLLVLLIVLLVFGAGRLPRVMNDIGKGVRSLREGMKEDEVELPPPPPPPARQVPHTTIDQVSPQERDKV